MQLVVTPGAALPEWVLAWRRWCTRNGRQAAGLSNGEKGGDTQGWRQPHFGAFERAAGAASRHQRCPVVDQRWWCTPPPFFNFKHLPAAPQGTTRPTTVEGRHTPDGQDSGTHTDESMPQLVLLLHLLERHNLAVQLVHKAGTLAGYSSTTYMVMDARTASDWENLPGRRRRHAPPPQWKLLPGVAGELRQRMWPDMHSSGGPDPGTGDHGALPHRTHGCQSG